MIGKKENSILIGIRLKRRILNDFPAAFTSVSIGKKTTWIGTIKTNSNQLLLGKKQNKFYMYNNRCKALSINDAMFGTC